MEKINKAVKEFNLIANAATAEQRQDAYYILGLTTHIGTVHGLPQNVLQARIKAEAGA